MSRQVTQCPVCDEPLRITELSCTACNTRLGGLFQAPPLARVAPEHQSFIETFVLCRGVIRDVEKVLGISYPTVRARLDAAVTALEAVYETGGAASSASTADTAAAARRRQELLRQVETGQLDPAQAVEALRRL